MSALFLVSLLINLGLITLTLSQVYPRAIRYYKERKKLQERRRKQEIYDIVNEYLNELRKDD